MTKNIIFLFRLGLACAVLLIFYFTTTPTEYEIAQTVNDKLSHALAFFGLSFLADFSFHREKFSLIKICPIITYGILIECVQYFLPYRSFSLLDIVGDIAGVVIYVLLLPMLVRLPVLRQRGPANHTLRKIGIC